MQGPLLRLLVLVLFVVSVMLRAVILGHCRILRTCLSAFEWTGPVHDFPNTTTQRGLRCFENTRRIANRHSTVLDLSQALGVSVRRRVQTSSRPLVNSVFQGRRIGGAAGPVGGTAYGPALVFGSADKLLVYRSLLAADETAVVAGRTGASSASQSTDEPLAGKANAHPRGQNPRVLFIVSRDCPECDGKWLDCGGQGPTSKRCALRGWKIGPAAENHLQIVDREAIPQLIEQFKPEHFPTVACLIGARSSARSTRAARRRLTCGRLPGWPKVSTSDRRLRSRGSPGRDDESLSAARQPLVDR